MKLKILSIIGTALCVTTSVGFLIPDGIEKVNTKYGEMVGFIDQFTFDNQNYQVRKFLGIPYAEPPIGNLRLKKPIMRRSLTSPFKALDYGPQCPQSNPYSQNMTMSEDCLFLNIFTPAESSIGLPSKPVMIWVHGGGFVIGSSNPYAGDAITALNDVIIVTLNYRLGALGFFSTHDDNAKGNYGLWDQHLAFRWVYENIGAFDGDNTNMTIFGESAGSSSVVYQMMYSGNEGIFKRVIAESGTLAAWGVGNGDANYKESLEFGRLLGCDDSDHMKVVACIQQQNQSDVVNAAVNVIAARPVLLNDTDSIWVPVFDNEFVPAKANTILKEMQNPNVDQKYSSFKSFDLMIGANNYDGLLYFVALLPYFQDKEDSAYDVFGKRLYDFVIPRAIESYLGDKPSPLAVELIKGEYTDWEDPTNITKRLALAEQVYTDFALNAPTILTADAHANSNSSTYVYQFSQASPRAVTRFPEMFHRDDVANHGDDLAYVFGMSQGVSDINLSKAMMTMWTNFAKSGNPNFPVSLQPLYDVVWPEYNEMDENYLVIDSKMSPSSVKQRLEARAVELWNNVLPDVQAFSKGESSN